MNIKKICGIVIHTFHNKHPKGFGLKTNFSMNKYGGGDWGPTPTTTWVLFVGASALK